MTHAHERSVNKVETYVRKVDRDLETILIIYLILLK